MTGEIYTGVLATCTPQPTRIVVAYSVIPKCLKLRTEAVEFASNGPHVTLSQHLLSDLFY